MAKPKWHCLLSISTHRLRHDFQFLVVEATGHWLVFTGVPVSHRCFQLGRSRFGQWSKKSCFEGGGINLATKSDFSSRYSHQTSAATIHGFGKSEELYATLQEMKRLISNSAVALLCIFFLCHCDGDPPPGAKEEKDIIVDNMWILKDYSIAALNSASDADGSFRSSLAAYHEDETIPADHQLSDPASGEKVDPIYHSGFGKNSPKETIIFACPFLYSDGTRGVSNVLGQAIRIPDSEYQAKIAAQ